MPTDGEGHSVDPVNRAFGSALLEHQVNEVCPDRGCCLILDIEAHEGEPASFDKYFSLNADEMSDVIATAAFMSALAVHLVEDLDTNHPGRNVMAAFAVTQARLTSEIEKHKHKFRFSGKFT